MKTTIKLAVASALVAVASSANAGISIPAGDWTLDIGGVVNAYYTHTNFSGDTGAGAAPLGLGDGNQDSSSNITTGLLPNYLTVSGKTRQNDLDVSFLISMNPGASQNNGLSGGGANNENRQAFLTFGDKSWGSIKLGKDLGIYASDAILSDMTLLGVGSGAGNLSGGTTTLGRIGTGYMYADWKSQVAYSSPNWNGFSFTAGVTQSWNAVATLDTSAGSAERGGSSPAFEAKASYEWAGDVAGKAWVSGISQRVKNIGASAGVSATAAAAITAANLAAGSNVTQAAVAAVAGRDDTANAWDIGATVNVAGVALTGYYGQGDGIGQTAQLFDGFDANGKSRDSDQWYVQATYTIPGVGTKLGASYGESTLDGNSAVDTFKDIEDNMWVIGAYHPLTKHLNLVAEYSESQRTVDNRTTATAEAEAKTISLGAILFF